MVKGQPERDGWSMEIMERVRQRRSVRTFEQRAVDQGAVRSCGSSYGTVPPPFGTPLRLELLSLIRLIPELKNLGTYGTIRGAGLYLIGAVKDIAGSQVDLGYCLEKVVLEATALGLGSCWLGGTFRRSRFARRIELADDELLPVVIPLGCPAESEKLWDRLIRSGSRSSRRKPWCELFFTEDGRTPLSEKDAGSYRNALEAVRLAPSALNRQPWRIIRTGGPLSPLFERSVFSTGPWGKSGCSMSISVSPCLILSWRPGSKRSPASGIPMPGRCPLPASSIWRYGTAAGNSFF